MPPEQELEAFLDRTRFPKSGAAIAAKKTLAAFAILKDVPDCGTLDTNLKTNCEALVENARELAAKVKYLH